MALHDFEEGALASPAAVQPLRITVDKRTQGAVFTASGGLGHVPFVFEGIHTRGTFRLEWQKTKGAGWTHTMAGTCNWMCYLDNNADLAKGYGPTNTDAARAHYYRTGKKEGRSCECKLGVWQTNFDEDTQRWRRTYNVPLDARAQKGYKIPFRFVWEECPPTTTATSTLTSTATSTGTTSATTTRTSTATFTGTTSATSTPTTTDTSTGTTTATTSTTTTTITTTTATTVAAAASVAAMPAAALAALVAKLEAEYATACAGDASTPACVAAMAQVVAAKAAQAAKAEAAPAASITAAAGNSGGSAGGSSGAAVAGAGGAGAPLATTRAGATTAGEVGGGGGGGTTAGDGGAATEAASSDKEAQKGDGDGDGMLIIIIAAAAGFVALVLAGVAAVNCRGHAASGGASMSSATKGLRYEAADGDGAASTYGLSVHESHENPVYEGNDAMAFDAPDFAVDAGYVDVEDEPPVASQYDDDGSDGSDDDE